jgi:hypothetical protein
MNRSPITGWRRSATNNTRPDWGPNVRKPIMSKVWLITGAGSGIGAGTAKIPFILKMRFMNTTYYPRRKTMKEKGVLT